MCVCVCVAIDIQYTVSATLGICLAGLSVCLQPVSINISGLFSSVSRRFAKNLSPDKINLSTLKGEGQLTNLELDEEVLQSLLDLPTWLAINRVECNKAAIRVRLGVVQFATYLLEMTTFREELWLQMETTLTLL